MRTTAVNTSHSRIGQHHVVAPSLYVADTPTALVFAAARMRGPIARDDIAKMTSLSVATVNRQVTALLNAGMLRERADLSAPRAVGRPRIPLEVNHQQFATVGMHIGARTISLVATDLMGRTLDAVEVSTPHTRQDAAMASLAGIAHRYLSRWRRRRLVWVGVAIGGGVDPATGTVTHPRLGWRDAPVGAVLGAALRLPVSVASHVDAMAAAELLLGNRRFRPPAATTLYVYARETVGYALVIGDRVHIPAGGPGTIAALPAYSELLGGSGRLESTVSDEAVLAAARRLTILPVDGRTATTAVLVRMARGGDEIAAALLADRARVLGEAIALLRDMLNPDDVVVGGQAFTEYPEGMSAVQAAQAEKSVLPLLDIRVSAFGNRVQEAGAGAVSLSGFYADPINAIRRWSARRHTFAVSDQQPQASA